MGEIRRIMKKKSIGNAMAMALAAGMFSDHVPWYQRVWWQKSGATPISTSRWKKPHQGERECARRRRQVAQGIIPKEQCL
jgi:hypothetical protein